MQLPDVNKGKRRLGSHSDVQDCFTSGFPRFFGSLGR